MTQWKEIYKDLISRAEDLDITSYRLFDGSYIMAEFLGEDVDSDIIFVDLPIEIIYNSEGILNLRSWMVQSYGKNNMPIPIQIYQYSIISQTPSTTHFKREYIKYNFLNEIQKTISSSEFSEVLEYISGNNKSIPDLDKQESNDYEKQMFEMFMKRLEYPFQN